MTGPVTDPLYNRDRNGYKSGMEIIPPLKAYRKNQEPPLSQQELANFLGVDRVTVARWEAGRKIKEKWLTAVSEKTGIPASKLRPDLAALLREAAE